MVFCPWPYLAGVASERSWFRVTGWERTCPSYLSLPPWTREPSPALSWHKGTWLGPGHGWKVQQLPQSTQSPKGWGQDLNPLSKGQGLLCILMVASSPPLLSSLLFPLSPLMPHPQPASLQGPLLPGNHTPGLALVTETPGGVCLNKCV